MQSNDFGDMLFRMELTYSEIGDIFEIKYIAATSNGYTLPPGIYEISDLKLMLTPLFLDDVKVSMTIDVIRLRSNSNTNKIL